MVLTIAATLLSAAPLIVVAPFEVVSPDPADADLGLAIQSLVEHELAAVAIKTRTGAELDAKNPEKLEGATHLVVGTVSRMGNQLFILPRLIELPNRVVATSKLKGPTAWNDRRQFTSAVVEALKVPMPARPDGYDVNEELARAWGAALRASGAPKLAKEKLTAIVEKWPRFMPAKARLAKL